MLQARKKLQHRFTRDAHAKGAQRIEGVPSIRYHKSDVKFGDLELREKSRCWSSSQVCSVKIVDCEGMKALARRLIMDNFAEAQYEKVIDPGLSAMSATILCKDHD